MGDFLLAIALILGFAWVARAMLGARELTWRRTIFAALVGFALGEAVGILLLVRNVDQLEDITGPELLRVSFPFIVIGTMGAIVVLELLFTRDRGRSPGRRHLFRGLGRRLDLVRRGWQISRIAVRNGLAPALGLRRGDVSSRDPQELARRTRNALEEAGGMFIKLGQLLATRPDLLPPEAQAELGRLHASAAPLSRPEVEAVLDEELGRPWQEVFREIDWDPLGSASIAQAHAAILLDGSEIVLKVQRPGLSELIERDLAIMQWLARTAERKTQWGGQYRVSDLTAEFADVLRGELDFNIEARNMSESAVALNRHRIKSPEVDGQLTTHRVLVMERLRGETLSSPATQLEPNQARALADALCKSQVEAMLGGERFHGDPHPGNVMVLENGSLGLIDFGIAGRLDAFERAAVFQMLVALGSEQPALLYEAMVSIGAVDPASDPDEIERALARYLAVHIGSGLPSPDALTQLLRLSNQLGLRLPRSATTMFRALATLSGTLETMSPAYPIIDVVAEVGGAELRERMLPGSLAELIQQEWAEIGPLLRRAPRHLERVSSLLEHGRLTTRLRLFAEPEDVAVLERLLNRIVLTLLSIGTGAVSVMLLGVEGGPVLGLVDVTLAEVLGWIGLTLAVILLLRILLAVLRTESAPPPGRR